MQTLVLIKKWWWLIAVVVVSVIVIIAIWQAQRKVKRLDRQMDNTPRVTTLVFIHAQKQRYAIHN